MYSYEDRIRAVKLYIKFGKRTGPTIRQLGYPTKNSLKGWFREHQQGRDLRAGYDRSTQKYSAQQMQVAVQHYLDHDRCIASTIRALVYPYRDLLTGWIAELHPEVRLRIVGRAPNVRRPQELKKAAVIELCTRTTSAQEIAEKLAVCRPTLYNWKHQLLGPEVPASMKRQNTPPPISDLTELQLQVESLRRDIHQLQLERDIMEKANELLKKGLGASPQLLSNRDKTLMVDAPKQAYALSELLAELDLARSSYFYQCSQLRSPDKYADVRVAITDALSEQSPLLLLQADARSPRPAPAANCKMHISEKVVQRLMKQECLIVAANRKRR